MIPTHATGDADGISTYPGLLLRIGAAEVLHISGSDSYAGALCGVSGNGRPINVVEYVGDRPRKVCGKCRAAFGRTKPLDTPPQGV